jgi:BMFP domain-containing protein YqiC
MPQTRGQFFDDVSRVFTDVAGLADSARREVETLVRAQLERLTANMNLVSREEFEAVREMAVRAREENDRLNQRVAALEARLGPGGAEPH